MKLLHLRGRKTSEFVLRKGKVWKGKTLTAYWVAGMPRTKGAAKPPAPGLYVGTFASAKLHKSAVTRNRMRRRVREALRTTVQEVTEMPSAQLLLTPRSASLDAPFEDIQSDVRNLLTLLSPSWQTRKKEN